MVCFTFQTNSPANKWIFVEGWPSWWCCCDDFPVQKKLFWNKKNALIVFPKPWSCIQMSYLFPFCCFVLTGIVKGSSTSWRFRCGTRKRLWGKKKRVQDLSETIGCNFLFFGQYHSREREPCNVPSPYPPWHITNVMCRANTTPDTFHVQCANALRSVAHFTCNVRGLYPLGTLQVRASANFYWSTPDRAPVGRGGASAVKQN